MYSNGAHLAMQNDNSIHRQRSQKPPPILFILFNRPDLAQVVFSQIQAARPDKLFIAVDGPRNTYVDDEVFCRECRQFAHKVDWSCEVFTLFQPDNLGCRVAISSAITWFFSHVDCGIILEDDCVPTPAFFAFCSLALERYQHDNRVMGICGFQPLSAEQLNYSCAFSRYNLLWGWATWARSWELYRDSIFYTEALKNQGGYEALFDRKEVAVYWRQAIQYALDETVSSWGYFWMLSCWVNNGLTLMPAVNLVSNIGFDHRSTHTQARALFTSEVKSFNFFQSIPESSLVFENRSVSKLIEELRFGIFAERPRNTVFVFAVRLFGKLNSFRKIVMDFVGFGKVI
jgi:hypothetical protein